MNQALDDVRVLDLTRHLVGPFCTKLLADYGADVIKVEKPGDGDPARRMAPFYHDEPHPEKSALFHYLNTNKRSVTLNLKSRAGRKILEELVGSVDILVESFSPRVMPGLGLSFERLHKLNPGLVMTSISSFGRTGPYRDFSATDLVEYAMGGPMYVTGLPEREPLKIADGLVQLQAGVTAVGATLVALCGSELNGQGEHVDVSIMETQLGTIDRRTLTLLSYQYTGEVSRRLEVPEQWRMASGIRRCKDGYIDIFADGSAGFVRVAQMIGKPELVEDPRFATTEAQTELENIDAFDEHFTPWLMQHTKQEIFQACQELRIVAGPINTSEDLLDDPHLLLRGLWTEVDHPWTGSVKYPGRPFLLSESPWSIRRPAPTLGQHNWEVLCGDLGYCRRDLARLRKMEVI
ncbi:MAG: CaiB/BaiF CoA transferase family protein [Dehalococcoidia bacterium]